SYAVAWAVNFATVDKEVTMNDQLTSSRNRWCKTKTEDHVVQTLLQKAKQNKTGGIFGAQSLHEKITELTLSNAVVKAKFLLFIQLFFVLAEALTTLTVLSGWIRTLISKLS